MAGMPPSTVSGGAEGSQTKKSKKGRKKKRNKDGGVPTSMQAMENGEQGGV